MQITIENVEHITLHLGHTPSPLGNILAGMLSGKGVESGVLKTPVGADTKLRDGANVQTTAQSVKQALEIGDHYKLAGGMYAGISRGEDGKADARIFLLDYKPTTKLSWADAIKWAQSLGDGARLPTKVESALLYANLQDQFDKDDWYWTGTQYSDYDAWNQYFGGGGQGSNHETYEARARAVRRLIL